MTQQISFEDFLAELSLKTSYAPELLKPIVFDLFVQIRTNTECGLWVEIEDFGSFHPLWYEIKKHKESKEDLRIREEIEAEKKRYAKRLKQAIKLAEELRLKKEEAKAEKIRQEELRVKEKRLKMEQIQKEAKKAGEEEQREKKERLEQKAKEEEALRLKEEQEVLERFEVQRLKKKKEAAESERNRKKELEAQKRREEERLAKQFEVLRLEKEKEAEYVEAEALRYKEEQMEVERLQKLRYEREAVEAKRIHKEELLKQADKRREEAFALGSHNLLRVQHTPLVKRDKRLLPYATLLVLLLLLVLWMMPDSREVAPAIKLAKVEKKVDKVLYKSFVKLEKTKEPTAEKFYKYTLEPGDSLYAISKRIYGDSKFWPLIYVYNKDQIKDVDKICPGNILNLSRIPRGSSAQEVLSKVYIQAYKSYKYVGKDNKAHWLLYWASRHIDREIMDKFSEDIEPEDKKKIEVYLERFNTLR